MDRGSEVSLNEDGEIVLTARGEFEFARAVGFDTYDDFVAWKTGKPEAYEKWYADLMRGEFNIPER